MSCLFISLSYFFNEDHIIIRKKICNYLELDNIIIDGMKTSDVLSIDRDNYILDMNNLSTMGGAIEIQCACNIWNCQINVHHSNNKYIDFLPLNKCINKIINIHWNGGHYEPIRS
jgi:hypothetical protein